jgi:hypothetical protein
MTLEDVMEKIKQAEEMAKFTGDYSIASEAKGKLKYLGLQSAVRFLESRGF